MNNIILFYIKDSLLLNFKNLSPADFFKSLKEDQERDYFGIKFSHKLDDKKTHNLFLNDSGFVYLNPHEEGIFFDLFKNDAPSKEIISKMMNKPLSDFQNIQGSEGIHLLAFYENDITDLEKDDKLFKTMTAYIRKTKSENKVIEGDSISARLFKEKQSPITYLAYIPKTKALWIDISNNLITFFGNKNIQLS